MSVIQIIPWQNDFVRTLADMTVESGDLVNRTVVFTHDRPRKYFKRALSEHPQMPRPGFMPTMLSNVDLFSELRKKLDPTPRRKAVKLDLIELLFGIVAELRQTGRGLLAELPDLDREAFLPWGIRLSSLLEELMRQNIRPSDFPHMQGDVEDYAAALLEQLGALSHAYVDALQQRGWATSGLDCATVMQHTDEAAALLAAKGPITLAGFYALSGAEDVLFRRLWEEGTATVVWHSDAGLAQGRAHWSLYEHRQWLRAWGAKAELAAEPESNSKRLNVRFVEGFDRHSQLSGLEAELKADTDISDTAILLPDTGALMPVLHHLPDKDVNISMGYPLGRTSLARLLEIIMQLQENRDEQGNYYWRDITALARHPHIRMLKNGEAGLGTVLHAWEAWLRQGSRFASIAEWAPIYTEAPLENEPAHLTEPMRLVVLATCIRGFEALDSPHALAVALERLCDMLHTYGSEFLHIQLVDAECLFRIATSVIPALKASEAAHAEYPPRALFSLLRELLRAERVSFEPEPLTGLQVIGALEARLLKFRKVFILDATEEKLPGTNPFDPLLPDTLRGMIGLPDAAKGDNVAAYNFYRLLHGAEESVIFYQSGIQPGLLDSKSVRSRFVEQLLWEREKELGRPTERGDDFLRIVSFPACPPSMDARSIPVTEQTRARIAELGAERGFSPTMLDTYMNCPLQFHYRYIAKLRALDEAGEDKLWSDFGSLVHDVLHEHLKPFIGRNLAAVDLNTDALIDAYRAKLDASDWFHRLPYDQRLVLRKVGTMRLRKLFNYKLDHVLLDLEKEYRAELSDGVFLQGRLDRVDQKDEGIIVIDYKTGTGQKPKTSLWSDPDIQAIIQTTGGTPSAEDLAILAETAVSVQLPAYIYMYAHSPNTMGHHVQDAWWIEIGQDGKPSELFPKKFDEEQREDLIKNFIPTLLNYLVWHMQNAEHFTAAPGKRCEWCDFKQACGA